MAKDIYTVVNGQPRKIINAFFNVEGIWKQAIPWSNTDGAWVDYSFISPPFVYVGTLNGELLKLDSKGEQLWSKPLADSVRTRSIAVDPDGNIYVGCGNKIVYKFDSDGNELWSVDIAWTIHGIAVDSDFVYIGSGYTIKLDKNDGSELWRAKSDEAYSNQDVTGISVDTSSGETFINVAIDSAVSGYDSAKQRYDSDGNSVWSDDIGDYNIYGSASADGKAFFGMVFPAFSSYNKVFAHEFVETVSRSDKKVWETGYLAKYYGGRTIDVVDDAVYLNNNEKIMSYDIDGNFIINMPVHSDLINCLSVSPEKAIYSGGNDNVLHKTDLNGENVWSKTYDSRVQAVATSPGTYGAFKSNWMG